MSEGALSFKKSFNKFEVSIKTFKLKLILENISHKGVKRQTHTIKWTAREQNTKNRNTKGDPL